MIYLSQEATDFDSNISEPWATWDENTTYSVESSVNGALTDVSVAKYGDYYYRTILDGNIDSIPTEHLGTKWIQWAVSNRHAMFDLRATTKTISDVGQDMVVEFPRGYIDTIAIGYYSAGSIRVDNLGILSLTYGGNNELTDYVIDSDAKYRPANDLGTILDDLPGGAPTPTHVLDFNNQFREIVYTQTEAHDYNSDVEDYYTYMYADYVLNVDRGRLMYLPHGGSHVRVTLYAESPTVSAACGYLVASEAVNMGETLYGVDFSFNSYSVKTTDEFGVLTINKRSIQDVVDFETSIDSATIAYTKRKIKTIHDEIVVFVLDESESSSYENLITLGTVTNVSTVLSNPVKTTIAWSIQETI